MDLEKISIYDEWKIMDLMENIKYGWMDKQYYCHFDDYDKFSDYYILQSPQEVIKNKVGICWDQVELERFYFESNHYIVRTFFICHYDNNKCPTHTFLTFEKDNKYYWFEHSWERFKGIYQYQSMKDLLLDVREKFIHSELNNSYEKNNLKLYEYQKPQSHIHVAEFYQNCEKGNYIHLEGFNEY